MNMRIKITILFFVILSLSLIGFTHESNTSNNSFPIDSVFTNCITPPFKNINGSGFRIDSLNLKQIDTTFFKKFISGVKLTFTDDKFTLNENTHLIFDKENPKWIYCDYRIFNNSIVFSIINLDSWGWGYYFYYIIYDKETKSLTSAICPAVVIGDGDFGASTKINWINRNTFMACISTIFHDESNPDYETVKHDSIDLQYNYNGSFFERKIILNKTITDTINTKK